MFFCFTSNHKIISDNKLKSNSLAQLSENTLFEMHGCRYKVKFDLPTGDVGDITRIHLCSWVAKQLLNNRCESIGSVARVC